MTMKALVVDDEAPARSELRYLLGEVGGVEVVGEASSAKEALQLIQAFSYDVVFLDIDMPGISGVELAEAMQRLESPPSVVFVTAYGEHAVKAFELAAADYLVKPVDTARLRLAVERLETTGPPVSGGARVERLAVEKAGRKLLLDASEIFHIMASDDYAYVFTDGERYLSTDSLAQLEKRLERSGFFRVHRRYLVNLTHVAEVTSMYGGTLLLTLKDSGKTQVPVSRRRVPSVKRALGL